MHLDIMRGASWLRENKSRFFTVLLFFFLFSPFPLLQQTVIAEDTVNVGIEKIWVDNNNADNTRPNSVGVTLSKPGTDYQVTLNSANDWKDIISDVDISGNYSVKETGIPDGYTTAVVQGELVSRYSYPTNISAVDIDLSTTVRDPIEITPPSGWYISDGMYTDYILTPTVFFNFNADSIKKATLVEYDGDGNEVTSQKQFQKYESSVQWAKSSGNPGTDHYITLTFKDAAVINDGTLNGTKRDVVLTINNFRSSTTGGFGFTTFLTSSGNWLNAAASGDKLNFDVNFRVPGITNGRTAITFVDLDVTSGPEAVYLRSGFEKTVYTISLNRSSINSNPMLLSGNKLGVSAVEDNLIMYAKASI